MLKKPSYYLKMSLPFFDLKSKSLPVIVLILLLAANFVYSISSSAMIAPLLEEVRSSSNAIEQYMSVEQTTMSAYPSESIPFLNISVYSGIMNVIILTILYTFITNIISAVFLYGSFKDLTDEKYDIGGCVTRVLSRFIKLLISMLIKSFSIIALFIIIAIPLLLFLDAFSAFGICIILTSVIIVYFNLMFFFVDMNILDSNISVIQAFKMSHKITYGYKVQVFKILLFCGLILSLLGGLFITLFSEFNQTVGIYISAFISSIMALINCRLTALLYADLTKRADEPEGE